MSSNKDKSEIEKLRQENETYRIILDTIHHGVMVTDQNGYITHFNKPYGSFLKLNPDEQIGKHCTEVLENTRMHIVAQTGIPEINYSHTVAGQDMIVQRVPMKKDGKIIGVFGQVTFKDVGDVRRLAEQMSLLESKVKVYEEELLALRSTQYTFDSIIGESSSLRALKKEALQAASHSFPVLITGPSGTGKELFAQAIHNASPRRPHPFVRINSAAIPKDLLESELFGYDKGAFTGAQSGGKRGKLEVAHRGSLFLDEISELPLEMQPKLLRVLEEKEFEHIGGNVPIRSDFRIISATNRDIRELVAKKEFRLDLLYRLNVFTVSIPPLNERKEDIIPIARHLLDSLSRELWLDTIILSPEVERLLMDHPWPGNVRELKNVLERAVSMLDGNVIESQHLSFLGRRKNTTGKNDTADTAVYTSAGARLKDISDDIEEKAIRDTLEKTANNKAAAARILGIHRTHLYKKLKKYNIQ